MSLCDGRLTAEQFEAIALEHGALPGYRYYEDAEVACDGPDEEALQPVFVRGQRVSTDSSGGHLVWIAVEDDVVLIGGDDFDAMLDDGESAMFDVYVPEEHLVGTPDRLRQLEALAYEIGGVVGFRSSGGELLFQPLIVRTQYGPFEGTTRISFAAEQVVLHDRHFARLLEGLLPPD